MKIKIVTKMFLKWLQMGRPRSLPTFVLFQSWSLLHFQTPLLPGPPQTGLITPSRCCFLPGTTFALGFLNCTVVSCWCVSSPRHWAPGGPEWHGGRQGEAVRVWEVCLTCKDSFFYRVLFCFLSATLTHSCGDLSETNSKFYKYLLCKITHFQKM